MLQLNLCCRVQVLVSRTDTEPPARPAAALSCYPKWKRRPWDSPDRMGNRGRCRKTCKVRGQTQGAPPPLRALSGFPRQSAPSSCQKSLRQLLASCPATSRSAPRRAPAFAGRLSGGLSGYRGRGASPRRGQGPAQKVQTGPRSCQASARRVPVLGCRCRTLPDPAAHPGDLGLIPVPPKTASKFMAVEFRVEVLASTPYVTHRPETGPEGSVPRVRRPQLPCRWQRRRLRRRELRLRGGFAGYPERQRDARVGWRWKCLCGVAGPGCSRCTTRGRSETRRQAAQTPPRVGSLPRSRHPRYARLSRGRNSRPGCALETIPSPLVTLLRSRDRVGRRLRRCWGGDTTAAFLSCGGGFVQGRGARKTPAFPLFPTGRATSSQRRTLEPQPRQQRGGPGPPPPPPAAAPCPPHSADRRRSPTEPRWLRTRFAGRLIMPGCDPLSWQAGPPGRGLRAESDRPGGPESWQPQSKRQRSDILSSPAAMPSASRRVQQSSAATVLAEQVGGSAAGKGKETGPALSSRVSSQE